MSTTDDAALVAELWRLNGGLDAEWGDDEAFDTLKTKLWLHRTRLLDLAEEAIRLRGLLLPDIIEQFAPTTIAKGLRDATEHKNHVVLVRGAAQQIADLIDEVENLREVLRHTHEVYCRGSYAVVSKHAPECLLYEVEDAETDRLKEKP